MRENGTLRYKMISGNMPLDDNGDPVSADESWSAAIPCLVRTANESMKARYEDGEYHSVSMEILIEYMQPFCKCGGSVIIDRKGEHLGEFRIVSVEEMPTVGRIRILV